MPLIKIDAKMTDREVKNLFSRILKKTGNLQPAMELAGEVVLESVQENFRVGGRPERWEESKRAKSKGLGNDKTGQTLVKTGGMRDSMTSRATGSEVMIGTNKPQAAIHNFGGKIKAHEVKPKRGKVLRFMGPDGWVSKKSVKIPEIEMPQREFLMVQDADWAEIKDNLAAYLLSL